MRSILLALTALVLAMPDAHAGDRPLPKHSLVCGSMASMKEADLAVSQGDTQWIGSLPECLFTNQPLKAARIECESRLCQIRLWTPGGQTAIAYTYRGNL